MIAGKFLSKVFNTGKVKSFYNDFAEGVSMGYNAFKYPFKMAGQGLHWIDQKLSHASNIPLLQDVANLMRDSPMWAELIGGVDSVNSTLDDIGKIGADVDDLIRRGFGFNYNNPSHFTPSFGVHQPSIIRGGSTFTEPGGGGVSTGVGDPGVSTSGPAVSISEPVDSVLIGATRTPGFRAGFGGVTA